MSPGRSNSLQFLGVGLKTFPERSCFFLFLEAGVKTSPGLTSSLLFQGTGLIQSPGLPAFLISSAGLKTSTTYQLFPISRSWGKNIPRMFLLLHKAVEDFFNHVPFIF